MAQAPGSAVLDVYSRLPHSLSISSAPSVLARPRSALHPTVKQQQNLVLTAAELLCN